MQYSKIKYVEVVWGGDVWKSGGVGSPCRLFYRPLRGLIYWHDLSRQEEILHSSKSLSNLVLGEIMMVLV